MRYVPHAGDRTPTLAPVNASTSAFHAAPHPGHRRFRLKPVPAIGDSVLSIGPSARFIAGTHTLSALLAPARASRQEGHGLFLSQLLVVWTC
jgi:hypothetical protein